MYRVTEHELPRSCSSSLFMDLSESAAIYVNIELLNSNVVLSRYNTRSWRFTTY